MKYSWINVHERILLVCRLLNAAGGRWIHYSYYKGELSAGLFIYWKVKRVFLANLSPLQASGQPEQVVKFSRCEIYGVWLQPAVFQDDVVLSSTSAKTLTAPFHSTSAAGKSGGRILASCWLATEACICQHFKRCQHLKQLVSPHTPASV